VALLLVFHLSCAGSALSIRIVFPDAASRDQSGKLWLYAVDAAAGLGCKSVLGRRPSEIGAGLLTSLELDLRQPADAASLAQVPMQPLLLAALVHDRDDRPFLQACARVDARPGDNIVVILRLNCAAGRTPCLDLDGDGVPADRDCDDEDPCRSPELAEAANLCEEGQSFPALPAACLLRLHDRGQSSAPPFCGDDIDQDCSGADIRCIKDADCDGFSPPQDCDDSEPAVSPAAAETCDGKDNNCNGMIDEGCSPCDVDGDGHAAPGASATACQVPRDDPDDYDAGIHPATTQKTAGAEGGNLLGALRGWCSGAPGSEKDGKVPREVDHDGDKVPAGQDGCPSASCDDDGDGFPARSCNPPASLEDCDDADPRSFPGAPDECGDGKAQNCVADASCASDKDGDGYCPPADCNDSEAEVHPWALEKCNARDDDCDELVDEANPDPAGFPMPVLVKTCNDDNDGNCGDCKLGPPADCKGGHLLSGICACSPVQPTGARDEADRIRCSGENLSAKASPRCFGARQPRKEICNGSDDDCDGTLGDETTEGCSPGLTCCPLQKACRDLTSDFQNCGGCGASCQTSTADDCKSSQCRCGGNPACSSGFRCQGGSCTCPGCVKSGGCYPGDSVTACGQGGESCDVCGDYESCNSYGNCICLGCLSAGTCYAGNTLTHCGKGGITCSACAPLPCQSASCSSGSCITTALPDLTLCSGGRCLGGACCTGCIGGSACQPGTALNACGIAGKNCADCVTGGYTACVAGTCQ
jgi:hypothetical protein